MNSESWPSAKASAFEVVPTKFYFFRRAHAQEFRAELRRLGIECTFGQTFSGGRERWMVTVDWQVLWHGPVLAHWFQEAMERWAPAEGKLGAEAMR